MNRQKLQSLASEWVRLAKNDIRHQVIEFMEGNDTNPRNLAYILGISEGEMSQILEGNGEITLTTFAKLLIATGHALEIKPIGETPIGTYDNVPSEPMHQPRPNIFERHNTNCPHFTRPTRSFDEDEMFEDFPSMDDEIPSFEEFCREMDKKRKVAKTQQPRDEHGRFMPKTPIHDVPKKPKMPTSPFETMSRSELEKIIRERLWDTEIDIEDAEKAELVEFLDEKDARMKEFKRMNELENDPKVNEFKNRLKNTLRDNPHLRDWAKKLVGEFDEE